MNCITILPNRLQPDNFLHATYITMTKMTTEWKKNLKKIKLKAQIENQIRYKRELPDRKSTLCNKLLQIMHMDDSFTTKYYKYEQENIIFFLFTIQFFFFFIIHWSNLICWSINVDASSAWLSLSILKTLCSWNDLYHVFKIGTDW